MIGIPVGIGSVSQVKIGKDIQARIGPDILVRIKTAIQVEIGNVFQVEIGSVFPAEIDKVIQAEIGRDILVRNSIVMQVEIDRDILLEIIDPVDPDPAPALVVILEIDIFKAEIMITEEDIQKRGMSVSIVGGAHLGIKGQIGTHQKKVKGGGAEKSTTGEVRASLPIEIGDMTRTIEAEVLIGKI
jgi:hypothetical protein